MEAVRQQLHTADVAHGALEEAAAMEGRRAHGHGGRHHHGLLERVEETLEGEGGRRRICAG